MELTIRKQTWKIDLVNNCVHELYREMSEACTEIAYISKDLGDKKEIVESLKTTEAIRAWTEDNNQKCTEATEKLQRLSRRVYALKYEIVQEVLESNEHVYDEKWWKRKTTPEDMNDFILFCIRKDHKGDSKTSKKK